MASFVLHHLCVPFGLPYIVHDQREASRGEQERSSNGKSEDYQVDLDTSYPARRVLGVDGRQAGALAQVKQQAD